MQVEKQQRLAEIRLQQQDTNRSVNMGKQVLSSLCDTFGNPVRCHSRLCLRCPGLIGRVAGVRQERPTPQIFPSQGSPEVDNSPKRILTTSPILSEKRVPR